jgi:hypothetical protein
VKDEPTSDTEELPDAPSNDKNRPSTPEAAEASKPTDSRNKKSEEELYEEEFAEDERWKLLEDLGAVLSEDIVEYVERRSAAQAAGDTDFAPLKIQPPQRPNEFFYFQFPQNMKALTKQEEQTDGPMMMDLTKQEDSKDDAAKDEQQEAGIDLAEIGSLPYDQEVGQLRFHQSGRITIRWGYGDDVRYYDVTRGFENRFGQEVYAFDHDATEFKDKNDNKIGHAYCLGNIAGRVVISTSEESLGMELEK